MTEILGASPVDHCEVAWLTTLRPDGSPHTTPIWFVTQENLIWMGTREPAAKLRHLRNDPRVSVALDGTGMGPYVAEGRARLINQPGDDHPGVIVLREKYAHADDDLATWPGVLIEITVERWLLTGS